MPAVLRPAALVLVLLLIPIRAHSQAPDAAGLFKARCESCHGAEAAESRAPDRASLRDRTPEAVLDAVTSGIVFSGAIDGHLRAYATADGRMLWQFDTVREFTTVNGVAAKGGSINGPGPAIVGGMLYTNSGYGQFSSSPGNVLLAFSAP